MGQSDWESLVRDSLWIPVCYTQHKQPHKILYLHEWRKKGRYIEDLLERQRHFMPLVLSVYRVMGEETKAETKQLSASLSKKCYR